MPRRIDAVILEGAAHSSLAIVRNLGTHGLRICVGAETAVACARASRYCREFLRHPSPAKDPQGALTALLAYLRKTPDSVVFFNSDRWHALYHAHVEAIRATGAIPAASPEAGFRSTCDKAETVERARRLGIPVPQTYMPTSAEEVQQLSRELPLPLVVKARTSIILQDNRFRHTGGVQYVRSADDLLPCWQRANAQLANPILQAWVPGIGVGVFLLCDEGKPIMRFAHRRIRDVIPTGSASALRESIAYPETLGRAAEKLAEDLRWTGAMMVEFRVNQSTGEYCLMEINGGRFWGSLQLAIDAGQEFPWAYYLLCRGERRTWPNEYRVGIRSRWLIGDCQSLVRALRGRPREFTGEYPTRLRAIRDFFLPSRKPTRLEVFRRSDPLPFAFECLHYAQRIFGEALRGSR